MATAEEVGVRLDLEGEEGLECGGQTSPQICWDAIGCLLAGSRDYEAMRSTGDVCQAQRGQTPKVGAREGKEERHRVTFGQIIAEAMGIALAFHLSFCSLFAFILCTTSLISFPSLVLFILLLQFP